MNQETNLETLRTTLRQFGLNPTDWRLKPHSEERLLLVHREDEDFQMMGFVEEGLSGYEWQELQVYSI
jgi:hypothetical protein